jgi:hypothetical protein
VSEKPTVTNYPTDQAAPDDSRTAWAKAGRGRVEAMMARGWPRAARFLSSIRAGSGSAALAAFDGLDGPISSDGTAAALLFSDRGNNANFAGWYENTTIRLNANGATDLWLINAATGIITQDAQTALTPGTNVTLGTGAYPRTGTRINKPDGMVYCEVSLTTGAAILAAATLATVTAAHRPGTNAVQLTWRRNSGGVFTSVPGFILTSGVISCDIALANGDILQTLTTYAI